MKASVFYYLLFITGLSFVQAQNPLIKQWDNRFGSTFGDANFMSFQQTSDGGYILGGFSGAVVGGDKTQPTKGHDDFWLVKIDSDGRKQWDVSIGGFDYDDLREIKQTPDHGYILGGYTKSRIGSDVTQDNWDTTSVSYYPQRPPDPPIAAIDLTNDFWIVKVDSVGNKQWDKRYGGLKDDFLYSLSPTTDGGYILGGTSFSGIGGDKTMSGDGGAGDYWVIKIDAEGHKQWDKTYDGGNKDELMALKQTTDGGFILGGYSYSGADRDKTDSSRGIMDYWIIKLDISGNKIWDKSFGGTGRDLFRSLQQTIDGGYILGGYTTSAMGGDISQNRKGGQDYWMVKISDSGAKQWDKRFGGDASDLQSVVQTTDSGYLLCGDISGSSGGGHGDISAYQQSFVYGSAGAVIWLVKTDESGNKQWDKSIPLKATTLWSHAIQTTDGGVSITTSTSADTGGYATVPNRDRFNIFSNFWIVKFADTSFVPIQPIPKLDSTVRIYPNPANNQLFIESKGTTIERVNIYDITGSLVISVSQSADSYQLSIGSLAKAVYIAEIRTKEGSVRKRWVKM